MVILTIALVVSTIMKYGTQVRLGGREGFGVSEEEEGMAKLTNDTKTDDDDKSTTPKTTPPVVTPTINVDVAEGDEKSQKLIAEKQAKLNNITKEYATLSEQMSTLEQQSVDINNSLTSVEQLMSRITKMINSETKT